MSDRVSKFAPRAHKRYGKICVRVSAMERATLVVWLGMAETTASADLRAYIQSTVRTIQRQISKLPQDEQDAFWADVNRELENDYKPGVGKGGRAKEVQKRLRELRKAA